VTDPTAHTALDQSSLRLAGVDPSTVQPREQAVMCWCLASTWHLAGRCDRHYIRPSVCERRRAL